MAEGLAHAAEVAVERGGFARAARLLGASETIRSEEGLEIPDIEAERYGGLVARIRDAMTPDEYQAAYADGSRLPPRAAVEEALGGLTVDTVTPG